MVVVTALSSIVSNWLDLDLTLDLCDVSGVCCLSVLRSSPFSCLIVVVVVCYSSTPLTVLFVLLCYFFSLLSYY